MFSFLTPAILTLCIAVSSSLTVRCYPDDYQIIQNDLFDGLYSLKNDQINTLQPGTYERAACNSNAAVYWCNDNEDRDAEANPNRSRRLCGKSSMTGMSAHTLNYAAGVVVYPTKIRVVVTKDDECLDQR